MSTAAARPVVTDDELIKRVGALPLAELAGLHLAGDGQPERDACCPWHEDQDPSASYNVEKGVLFCHVCSKGVSAVGLYADAHHGGDLRSARRELRRIAGLAEPRQASSKQRLIVGDDKQAEATFIYRDENGAVLYRVCRKRKRNGEKWFDQQASEDGQSQWLQGKGAMKGVRRVLYRLPELMKSATTTNTVFIPEGEKHVDRLYKLGCIATTSPGGAGKWRKEYGEQLKGRRVAILPDNDDPGRKHAQKVAQALHGVAASVKVVELPDLPPKGDVIDWLDAGGTVEQLQGLACDASEYLPPTDTQLDGGRPCIVIRAELSALTNEAQAALVDDSGTELYTRSRLLVRVVRDSKQKVPSLTRPAGALSIEPVTLAALREGLDQAAQWMTYSGEDLVPALPPKWVAETLAARGMWPFPSLEAVVETPTMRPDGSVLETSGYDEQTAVLYLPAIEYPPVPAMPTRDDATRAAVRLLAPLRDYPWVADTDPAAAISAILTVVGRTAIDGPCPMFAIRASTPGTGKSLLADVISLIGTGRTASRMTQGRDDDEVRKRILAIALEGAPVVLLDNLEGALGSPSLAAALTGCEFADRLLGQSKRVTAPLRMLWLCTGNNLSFKGDLGRRVLPIDLDAEVEHPEDRTGFEHPDLLSHVRAERPQLVTAALTILRAYHMAGRPAHGKARKGSFESWDDLVRGAVVWAMSRDPIDTTARIRTEGDLELDSLRAALAAWRELFGPTAATVHEALERTSDKPEPRAALAGLTGCDPGKLTVRALGYGLRKHKGRIVDVQRLVLDGMSHGRMRWRVEGVSG